MTIIAPSQLFVYSFPGFISATIDLVKTLDAHRTGSDWSKSVGTKLDKMVGAVRSEWCSYGKVARATFSVE